MTRAPESNPIVAPGEEAPKPPSPGEGLPHWAPQLVLNLVAQVEAPLEAPPILQRHNQTDEPIGPVYDHIMRELAGFESLAVKQVQDYLNFIQSHADQITKECLAIGLEADLGSGEEPAEWAKLAELKKINWNALGSKVSASAEMDLSPWDRSRFNKYVMAVKAMAYHTGDLLEELPFAGNLSHYNHYFEYHSGRMGHDKQFTLASTAEQAINKFGVSGAYADRFRWLCDRIAKEVSAAMELK